MAADKKASIQVFQELYLRHAMGAETLRAALLQYAGGRWIHRSDREQDMRDSADMDSTDVIAFERPPAEGRPGVSLWMFEDDHGYKVSNIVPMTSGDLGIRGYNDALLDFYSEIVSPAISSAGISVVLTTADQSIEDWTDTITASALKRFSGLANKSTGHSHPLDDQRWQDFVIAAHHGNNPPDADRLARWLIEVERWPDDIAHELASDYSNGLQLLNRYDRSR